MTLEAVVYPQDPFSYISKYFPFQEEDDQDSQVIKNNIELGQGQEHAFAPSNGTTGDNIEDVLQWSRDLPYGSAAVDTENQPLPSDVVEEGGRRKRKRTRSRKNKEEIENQRMTHIAVERNRRKQMNEYLAVLRSLMPPSYVQRGDQASIIGGTINYIKVLEHHLQAMEHLVKTAAEDTRTGHHQTNTMITTSSPGPFSNSLAFPQYSSRPTSAETAEEVAEIEVNMVDSHASLKILTKKRPRQLLKLVTSIHNLRLSILHLNVNTGEESVLYSINVKVEEGSQLKKVEDIAAVVKQIIKMTEEES